MIIIVRYHYYAVCLYMNQPTNQPTNQPARQPASQPVSQPLSPMHVALQLLSTVPTVMSVTRHSAADLDLPNDISPDALFLEPKH
jgi:hypothetical protein